MLAVIAPRLRPDTPLKSEVRCYCIVTGPLRSGPLLLAVTAVFSLPGCTGPGLSHHAAGERATTKRPPPRRWWSEVGIGATTEWSAPAGMEVPSTVPVLDIAVVGGGKLAAGITTTGGGESGEIIVLSGSLDMGALLGGLFYVGETFPLVLVPEAGLWFGDDTTESRGLYTGLRVGTGYWKRGSRDRLVTLDYRWVTLHGFSGDKEARMQAVSVRYLW